MKTSQMQHTKNFFVSKFGLRRSQLNRTRVKQNFCFFGHLKSVLLESEKVNALNMNFLSRRFVFLFIKPNQLNQYAKGAKS